MVERSIPVIDQPILHHHHYPTGSCSWDCNDNQIVFHDVSHIDIRHQCRQPKRSLLHHCLLSGSIYDKELHPSIATSHAPYYLLMIDMHGVHGAV